jgi:hypothetical protein
MLSFKDLDRAHRLKAERESIAKARWNMVVAERQESGWRTDDAAKADEQLQLAIEEFRARKLAAIDAELRELGIDPGTEPPEPPEPARRIVTAIYAPRPK